jgi:hypothetical protein
MKAPETATEFREWLLHRLDRFEDWTKPMTEADIPEGVEVVEVDEDWPGPDVELIGMDAAKFVEEAGEIALRFGLPDLYRATRVHCCPEYRFQTLPIVDAKELLGRCLAAVNEMMERSAPAAPAAVAAVPPQEAADLAQAKKRTTAESEALAMSLLVSHPDWSKNKIAETVGVARRTLYNWPRFTAAWRAANAKDTKAVPRGFKTSDGRIEAYTSPAKCASCGEIAIESYKNEDYCRECYFEKVREEQEAEKRKDDAAEMGRRRRFA